VCEKTKAERSGKINLRNIINAIGARKRDKSALSFQMILKSAIKELLNLIHTIFRLKYIKKETN
jgi:hypothetical protein